MMAGRTAQARPPIQRAVAILEETAAANPSRRDVRDELSRYYCDLGEVEAAEGHPLEARTWYEKVLRRPAKGRRGRPRRLPGPLPLGRRAAADRHDVPGIGPARRRDRPLPTVPGHPRRLDVADAGGRLRYRLLPLADRRRRGRIGLGPDARRRSRRGRAGGGRSARGVRPRLRQPRVGQYVWIIPPHGAATFEGAK